MHVSIWGEKHATPVVMTHGMAAWGGLWKETAIELAKNGYRVIAVDQPPFGFSDRSDGDFSRSTQAKRIGELVVAMGLKNYVLLGHSYGGGVAMEMALRYPKNISGVVLVCPVMVLADKGTEKLQPDEVPLPLRFTPLAEALVSLTITNPMMTRLLISQFMHRKDRLTAQHVGVLQRPAKLKGNTANMVVWLKQFLAGDPQAQSRHREQLAGNKLPVSLIWGKKDTVTPINQGDELAGILNLKRFTRLSNVGHMPQLEDPELFNKTLLKTLQDFAVTTSALGLRPSIW
jgi:pimeloyl-ACP methyl ester carboxylesterase